MLLLLLPCLVWADDFACEDTQTPEKYRRYQPSQDPSTLLLQPNEVCYAIPEAELPAQRAACMDGTTPPPTIPLQYRKIVNQLCAEMTQAEKDAVDAVAAAIAAQNQAYVTERADPGCTEKQLQQISQALTNRQTAKQDQDATAKAAIKATIDASPLDRTLLKAVVDDYYARIDSDRGDEYGLFEKVSRCLRAHVGLRQ